MEKMYNNKEAAKLLSLGERDIGALRERIGVGMGGKLNENNITAIRSYIKKVGYVKIPAKRGRPPKQKEPTKEIDEKHQKEVETSQTQTKEELMYIPVERVKELVIEAYNLGVTETRKKFKSYRVTLDELLVDDST